MSQKDILKSLVVNHKNRLKKMEKELFSKYKKKGEKKSETLINILTLSEPDIDEYKILLRDSELFKSMKATKNKPVRVNSNKGVLRRSGITALYPIPLALKNSEIFPYIEEISLNEKNKNKKCNIIENDMICSTHLFSAVTKFFGKRTFSIDDDVIQKVFSSFIKETPKEITTIRKLTSSYLSWANK